ncbi:hypothetical protein JS533_006145 [Bifidobacterium amazonense]|uniref:Uncharacterized protein n=1 Tax=Bifidobacterium amazonense TaxID=2809027 RepID=A0ABS9VUV1_9BIFI|nr:hypothetical protein [Bifidobacterium amazonense]MCH9275852.1 hypothetical protein [Bifidobacterium amazonense]
MTESIASTEPSRPEPAQPSPQFTQRFPQLSGFEHMDDDRRIAAFRDVLDQLTHELDEVR